MEQRWVPTTAEDHRIAWLAALAVTIHMLESAFPSPVPGVKPGLANVVVIVVLLWYGWRAAAWVSLLRVLAGSLLLGTFLSPTFILSLSGALASVAVLGLAKGLSDWLPAWGPGPVGYSVLSALAHMAAQFTVAWLLFIPHAALLKLLPALMTAAAVFGIVSGWMASAVLRRVHA